MSKQEKKEICALVRYRINNKKGVILERGSKVIRAKNYTELDRKIAIMQVSYGYTHRNSFLNIEDIED